MAQFDVYKNPRGGAYPLLLDVQADILERLATRMVVPLMARKRYGAKPISKLNPVCTLGGTEYVLVFQEMASVPASALGDRLHSLSARRAELVGAIDLLFTGV